MWFKNLQVYQINKDTVFTAEQLQEGMLKDAFQPCGQMDLATQGWDMPLGKHGTELIHETNGFVMVCLKTQEKLLPASVLNEMVAEKVEELENQDGRKIGRKEKQQLKDELIIDLLPRAFTRSRKTYAYFDLKKNLFIVDSAAPKKAEDLISEMRESLGSFPVKPIALKKPISFTLTQWAQGQVDPAIEVGQDAELRDSGEDAGVIRCKGIDLMDEKIQNHLQNGKEVTQLSFSWQERLSCALTQDFSIKSIKFLDAVQEEAGANSGDDFASRFDSDFAIMSGEFNVFLPWLFEQFGGLTD